MDKQDATARAERLVNKTMPDVIIATSAIDRKSSFTVDVTDWKKDFKKRITAALLAVQRDAYNEALEDVANDWQSKGLRGHDEIQSVEVQAFLDTRHVHYPKARGIREGQP